MAWVRKYGVGIVLKHNLIIFGGSFDPIHLGHINTALNVLKHIKFERFIFLPCKTPVIKNATMASCEQRVHMLKLALKPYPDFEMDLREIQRATPSYMVETLQSFRDELGENVSITLLLGMDAFLQLPQWYSWQKILELSHLLVINRAQNDLINLPEQMKNTLATHQVFNKTELLNSTSGKIYQYNAGEYDISSSELRKKISIGTDVSCSLPQDVHQYIKKYNLY